MDMFKIPIPIRNEIQILGPDKIASPDDSIIITSKDTIHDSHKPLGWVIRETIGIAVINPRAISKLKINNK